MKPLFKYTFKSGGMIPIDAQKMLLDMLLEHSGKEVTLILEPKRRTKKQNSFYWFKIVPAIKDFWFDGGEVFDLEETHDRIVRDVWKYTKPYMLEGESREVRRSSTEATVKLWQDFQEVTYAYFAERGLILPSPEQQIPLHMQEALYMAG